MKGAVLGNQRLRLVWFRDVRCEPPDWPVAPVSDQHVTMNAPGSVWQAEYFDPVTGKSTGKTRINVQDGRLRIELGKFQDAIAVRLKQIEP